MQAVNEGGSRRGMAARCLQIYIKFVSVNSKHNFLVSKKMFFFSNDDGFICKHTLTNVSGNPSFRLHNLSHLQWIMQPSMNIGRGVHHDACAAEHHPRFGAMQMMPQHKIHSFTCESVWTGKYDIWPSSRGFNTVLVPTPPQRPIDFYDNCYEPERAHSEAVFGLTIQLLWWHCNVGHRSTQ